MSIASMRQEFNNNNKINFAGLNNFAVDSVITELEDASREVFSDIMEVYQAAECTAEMENYLVEFEGYEEGTTFDMEGAVGDTLARWRDAIKQQIEGLLAKIQAWIDSFMDKHDEKWWDAYAEKAGEHKGSAKESISMHPWDWTVTSSKIEENFKGKVKAFEDALDVFEKSASVESHNKDTSETKGDAPASSTKSSSAAEGLSGKESTQMSSLFMLGGASSTKTSSVKLNTLDIAKMGVVFKTAREDRNIIKIAQRELKSLKVNINKISNTSVESGKSESLKAVKKNLNVVYGSCKTAIKLVMTRRQEIKSAVSALYSHYKTTEGKDKSEDK